MLAADKEAYKNRLMTMDRDELIHTALETFVTSSDQQLKITEMEASNQQMFLEFDAMKNLSESLKRENRELRKQLMHLTGVSNSQAQEMYGKSSEKMVTIREEAAKATEYTDPLSEGELPEEADQPFNGSGTGKKAGKKTGKVVRFPGKTTGGRTKIDLSKLPRSEIYEYDIDELNARYGEGEWRFSFWEKNETIEVVKQHSYVKVTYTPVISQGLEHILSRVPFEGRIIPKSYASSSLLALMLSDYGNLHLPSYRIEHDEEHYGIQISRQTMTNWRINVSEKLLTPICDHMAGILKTIPYQQCDETTYTAITERMHVTNYIWVHRTSEMYDTDPIILYCFEPSRSADHLIRFYEGLTSHIHLTTDAYGAYSTLEATYPGLITLCGCFMHARRRPVDSLSAIRGLTEEAIKDLPEMKMIEKCVSLYTSESGLRDLSATDRLEKRRESVKPIVDEYFEYIHSLDEDDPSYSDKLKDAIGYSKNHEEQLRRFLEDGNIPIDNGAAERAVKPVACHRKNSLFSFSERGAKSTMTLMSLIETAKGNGASPYYYLKYVMENMAKYVYYNHPCNLNDMMPWSSAYRSYEEDQKLHPSSPGIPPNNEKPHTPRKRDRVKEIA
ncbi:MAG: IS66 family transposase [Acetatifactor sp.]|nr:IS66 family transposase [Acetatifactor sp.]